MLLFLFLALTLLPSIPLSEACNPGQSKSGTHCTDCTPGTYAPTLDSPACIPCPRGSSSPQSAAASCTLCAPGSIQPSEGASDCASCHRNQVQPFRGRLDCIPCAPGSFPDPERATCVPCPVGKIGDPVTNECIPCPVGKVAPQPGLAGCISCPVATYSSPDGSKCLPCSTGYVTLGVEAWQEGQCVDCQTVFNSTFEPVKDLCVLLKCAPFLSKTSPFIQARMVAQWMGDGDAYVSGAGCDLVQAVAPAGSPLGQLTPAFRALDNQTAQRIGLWLLEALVVGLMLNAVWSFLSRRCARGGRGKGEGVRKDEVGGRPSPMIGGRVQGAEQAEGARGGSKDGGTGGEGPGERAD